MSQEWKVNDPVSIEAKSATASTPSSKLQQGVVAFVGPVSFSEGNDWVGVRLTGDSIGRGKNDGSVKGVRYFECTQNCGMFVKSSVLRKRTLSRLEELRLKRLTKTGTGTTSPSIKRRLNLSGSADDDSSVSSMTSMRSSVTSGTARSRLDEIKSRRLALQQQRNNSKLSATAESTASSTTPMKSPRQLHMKTPTPRKRDPAEPNQSSMKKHANQVPSSMKKPINQVPSSTKRRPSPSSSSNIPSTSPKTNASYNKPAIENSHLKTKIEILNDKLQLSEKKCKTISTELDSSAKEIHELKMKIIELNGSIENIQQDAGIKIASAVAASNNDDYKEEIGQLKEEIQKLQSSNAKMKKEKKDEKDQMQMKLQHHITTIQETSDQELSQKDAENSILQKQLTEFEGKVSFLEKSMNEKEEKDALREDNDSTHYKERAKLQAEILSWSRKVQDVSKEKLELEMTMEDLTLDKETLQERCEDIQDQLDELNIDAESAQIELEELKLDLESERTRAEKAESAIAVIKASNRSGGIDSGKSSQNDNSDTDDVVQALSLQNARLREAIIRLREQTAFEKIESTKQLRAAEKESAIVEGLKEEVTKLLFKEQNLKLEVNELKEMVDQGSAFEAMVEELSDRVLAVEDNNISLQGDIREFEEAADLSAEMEEAQAEEIKALMRELQSKDTITVNLEEAIKIQRRRELDFQRTIGNYRKSIETLQKEKHSLLTLHQGDEGEKKDALIASQKALAQAAHSVAEAISARRKEAEATFNLIGAKVKGHLAERLENCLPQNLASSEILAVKGELLMSKIAMKSSLSLQSLSEMFYRTLNTAVDEIKNTHISSLGGVTSMAVTSSISHHVTSISHQTKFAQIAIEISSECLRLLSFSQWPNLLSSETSVDFSIAVSRAIVQLDKAISTQLLKLKEEGSFAPHQSNLTVISQSFQTLQTGIEKIMDENGDILILKGWNPPGLGIFTNITSAKFSCLGTASMVASIINAGVESANDNTTFAASTFKEVHSLFIDIKTASDSLMYIDVLNEDLISKLSVMTSELNKFSADLFAKVQEIFSRKNITSSDLGDVLVISQSINPLINTFATFVQTNTNSEVGSKEESYFSPEISDPWESLKSIAEKVKISMNEEEDMNYVIRGREMEEQLSSAVENDAKLSIANSKVRSLQKNLDTRSKEISMQNSRLKELEAMLSTTEIISTTDTITRTNGTTPSKSNDETIELNDEIRVLNEAMEVLQTQVDEYEKEIRTLKDPQKSRTNRKAPGSARKSFQIPDSSLPLFQIGEGNSLTLSSSSQEFKSGLMEAALFRPALHAARADAAAWKSKAIRDTLMKLSPLQPDCCSVTQSDLRTQKHTLFLASAELRRNKSNITIIDLKNKIESRNVDINREKTARSLRKLHEITNAIRFTVRSH